MENKSQLEQSFGTFNMETSTIDFNGITYDYTKEQLCCDNQLTYSQFNDNKSNGIFPQGESYIESIIQSEEKVIILESKINEQMAWFYFPLIKYEDLCYSEVYRMVDKNRVKSKFDEYETDNYPQGREYCQELINNGLNKGECFYIIARQNGEKWARNYFKSEYIKIYPDEVSLLTGKDQLKNALDFISNNNNDNFPQNKAKCIDIINSQIESDGEVFVLESSEPDSNKKTWHYFMKCYGFYERTLLNFINKQFFYSLD